jgi:nucleoid DNA-binding protein
MRKKEIAREVSRQTGMTRAEAADQVDRLVHEILRKLRSGESARLPGLGTLEVSEGRITLREETGS